MIKKNKEKTELQKSEIKKIRERLNDKELPLRAIQRSNLQAYLKNLEEN